MQITHMVHPDTNQERELIIKQLRAKRLVRNIKTVPLDRPYFLINRAISGYLQTDGNMAIIHLRQPSKS
jgi:hypothetical protein